LNLGVREGEKVLFRLADGSEMSVELYALPTRRGSQAKFSIVAPRRVQILRERLARELPPGASLLSRRSNPAA
jgi:sRNA-binding carbon storage regulator CsrA